MRHSDLEEKLQQLKEQRKQTLEAFKDLASEATSSADRSSKTMMMFIPPNCTCNGIPDSKCTQHKTTEKVTKRLKKKKSNKA
jgi:hypothetical protein